ncbi:MULTISPECIES: DUF1836 domain-containing protein [Bacillus]|uniref:DUF1836 domain-containing protein n=1 Tax=Bacillus smithii 7_3_47FAA TaxID=665952 RepID=G9QHT0_9BACI|nr:DUF1836 domain-containing protein [Bacillus smithii]AKP46981.1 hypothetical protein BSM4216_1705 [Bacillus smithii]EHL79277.1 hypothetical protein HMPREF1015_01294 [Bacillus smithii 7_3_47FAA]MED0660919.1 DUF1836 domain-containing protein [Bacillus smithii]MED1421507.1 DUF1836 domain-containing protein [Bacillus smithii]MED1454873.1 DUF1836 domain-containing protein [Bacillus smithii]
MNTFQLTRKEMAFLLLSLKGWSKKPPLSVLQEAWIHSEEHGSLSELDPNAANVGTLPPIFEKIIKTNKLDRGFSLNEIAALGNQIEYTNFSVTALQNWIKRDIKEMIGSPQKGKKYSLEQTALLFIVEDLKTALDFESIRQLLKLIINDPDDQKDDLINPIHLYACYSTLFEEINDHSLSENRLPNEGTIETIERIIKYKAEEMVQEHFQLDEEKRKAIKNIIIIAVLSVHTAYFHMLAKRSLSAALFLQNLPFS